MTRVRWREMLLAALWCAGCDRLGLPAGSSALILSFIKPMDGQQLTVADETDPDAPGFQTDVEVLVQDSRGRPVQLASAQIQTRLSSDSAFTPGVNPQISGGTVLFPKNTLQPGTNVIQVSMLESVTQRRATQAITVTVPTLAPPTLHVTAPAAGASSHHLVAIAATLTGDGVQGRPMHVFDQPSGSIQSQPVGALNVSNGSASGGLVFPAGTHTIRAVVMDVVGQQASDSVSGVTVSGCTLAITAPPQTPFVFNRSTDADPNTPGLQYSFTGVSPDCLNAQVRLYKGSNLATPIYTATTNNLTGIFSIYITLNDGDQTRLTAQVTDTDGSNAITSAFVDVTVKISPPVLSGISPPQSTLFYVANSNFNLFLNPPTPGYIQDKIPDGNAEADFSFTVSNALGGIARLVYRGADLVPPQNITADPQTFSFVNAVLQQKTSGVLQFLATDSAGNGAASSANVTVDVIPPAASSFTTKALAPGAERTATVNLAWTASGDDGLSGTPVGYDLRWGTNVTLLDGGIDNDFTFFDPNQTKAVTSPGGGLLPPTTTNSTLTSLPPLASYSFMVKARDAIGNDARYVAVPNLDNFLHTQTLTNPDTSVGTASGFGAYLFSRADFNGDGADDLVVGAALNSNPSASGEVWVYYGTPSVPPASPFTTPPQQLAPADGASGFFGLDFSVGNVGDPVGDVARPDLLVSQNVWSGGRGRAFLFFGGTGVQLNSANVIQFRGTSGVSGSFSGAVRIISDINGDGLDEILISAHRENSSVGKVYLFYGRSVANWQALQTAQDLPDTTFYIPTSAADRVFVGDGPPDNFFGRLRGYADVGNIGAGGVSFTVPASLDSVNKLFIHSGSLVNGRGAGGTIATTDAIQVLTRTPATSSGSLSGFGEDAFGNFDLIGGPGKDLIVTLPKDNKVYLFPDGTATGFNNPPVVLSSINGNFGDSLSYGDINLDGQLDILVGENRAPSTQQSLWIFYNQRLAGGAFDSTAGSGFSQSRLPGPLNLGTGIAVGDFNGDGKPDIAAGAVFDSPGKVYVWY